MECQEKDKNTTDSDSQLIRRATIDDLDALAAMEPECSPAVETADRPLLHARIETYPGCLWLLIDGRIIMAFINGFAIDWRDLTNDMYEDAVQHNPQGNWQMILGADTAPKYQHRGCASTLMREVIEDTRAAGCKGLVLTCKNRLVGSCAQFGYEDEGISESTHGDVVRCQMRLVF